MMKAAKSMINKSFIYQIARFKYFYIHCINHRIFPTLLISHVKGLYYYFYKYSNFMYITLVTIMNYQI